MMNTNNHKGDYAMTTTAQKWGNSIGVRIPRKIAKEYGVSDGSQIEVSGDKKGIILKPVEQDPTLEELLAKCVGENPHEEFFSRPVGREEI